MPTNFTTSLTAEQAVQVTRCWVEKFVVAENLCPFAKPFTDAGVVDYVVCEETKADRVLEELVEQLLRLNESGDDSVATILFILKNSSADFEDYLDLLDMANALLEPIGLEGEIQIASFHPDYQFEGTKVDDLENYTNRAPFPIFHLIKEAHITEALESVSNPERIPERNRAHMDKLGLETIKQILESCINSYQ